MISKQCRLGNSKQAANKITLIELVIRNLQKCGYMSPERSDRDTSGKESFLHRDKVDGLSEALTQLLEVINDNF